MDYREEAYDKGEKVAKDLSNALNSSASNEEVIKGFVEGMTQQHRTIQQSSMRAIMSLIEEWAKMGKEGNFDLRNQTTVKFCQKIIEECGKDYFPFI